MTRRAGADSPFASTAAVLALSAFSGYNWVAMKIALASAGPFPFTALRSGGAALIMFAALALARKRLAPPAPLRSLALLGLIQTAGVMSLINFALAGGAAGKSAMLVFTMPFWLLALAVPVLHERLTRAKLVAGLLGLLGVVFTFAPWTAPPDLLSMLFATGAGLCWAIGGLIVKRMPLQGAWDLTALTAWQVALGTLPLVVLAVLVPGGGIRVGGGFLLAALYAVGPGTALAWLLWFFLLERLPAGVTGLLSLLAPVVGLGAAWLQLGERPGPWEGAGMALIVLALAALGLAQAREARIRTRRRAAG